MKIDGKTTRTIWQAGDAVEVIDQRHLPFAFETLRLTTMLEARDAIRDMAVRGAPRVGATAAYGLALAMRADPSDASLMAASDTLFQARPTAVNLGWALKRQNAELTRLAPAQRAEAGFRIAAAICDEDVAINSAIGDHALPLLRAIAHRKPGAVVNILTHCNAGWLATVDWGTALAPIYKAHDAGLAVHVWVDETRPRNQGAYLTAYELGQHGVPHTVIVDNAGGHLMQHGLVDICFVGTDRTTRSGDVCNKIGTYLKALAAQDNGVPFYVCAPSPSIDFSIDDGLRDIPIETRSPREVSHILGMSEAHGPLTVDILPPGSPARNDAFDVTPARYVTGLVTERGVVATRRDAISAMFRERVAELA
jgi:methylthioribose-1-phosphate isomerase